MSDDDAPAEDQQPPRLKLVERLAQRCQILSEPQLDGGDGEAMLNVH